MDCADHQQPINNCRACTNESDRTGKWLPMFVAKTPVRDMSAYVSDDSSIETSESEAVPFVPTDEVLRPCTDKKVREFPEPVSPELAGRFIKGLAPRLTIKLDDAGFAALRPGSATVADSTTGVKFDDGKPDLSLLPPEALTEIAKVLTFGAKKYAAHNWRKGFKWTRVFASTLRHLFAWLRGEDLDPETGLSHLAHAGCNVLFLLTFVLTKTGEDDRYKPA